MSDPASFALDRPGLLLVVSGPSGGGKSTLVRELVQGGEFPIDYSVSATSRAPRPGEVEGRDYFFLSRDSFAARAAAGEFLEHAEVHGNLYGTPKAAVRAGLANGRWILLEIDVAGQRQVKQVLPEAVSFFIRAPSLEDLEARLRRRRTEDEAAIARRLADARAELAAAATFDFQIVNETVPQAVRTFRTLLKGLVAERHSSCTTS